MIKKNLTERNINGIPSSVVGPIPSNFRGPKSVIFLGLSFSDSLVYSCFTSYTILKKGNIGIDEY